NEVARIDLVLRTPHFREDQFRDLFKEEPARPVPPAPQTAPAPAAADSKPADAAPPKGKTPEPVKIAFEGIHDRLTLLPTGLDVNSVVISPDGKTAVLVAVVAGQQNLYSYSL